MTGFHKNTIGHSFWLTQHTFKYSNSADEQERQFMAAANGGDSWDVVRDLHFLFATDTQLQNELTYVCDLLNDPAASLLSTDTTGSPTSSSPAEGETPPLAQPSAARPGSKVNKFRERQKREIESLRCEVETLKENILDVKREASLAKCGSASSSWERAAHEELYAKTKALAENARLRADVEQHATFIDDMTRVLRKRPRLSMHTDVASEEWQAYKLAAHASLRVAAIHAIADRQYTRLQPAFIRTGLFDRVEDHMSVAPQRQHDGTVLIEYVYHLTVDAPWRQIGAAVWNVCNGTDGLTLPPGATESTERIDACTAYRAFHRVHADASVHLNLAWKYYVEPTREVVVFRAVLDDALVPRMKDGVVGDEWGWIVVEPVDEGQCRLRAIMQIVGVNETKDGAPTSIDDAVATCMAAVEKFSLREPAAAILEGNFPGVEKKADYEDLPFALRTLFEWGKGFELGLREAIHRVKEAVEAAGGAAVCSRV
ncbi:Aste57867_23742 [Aphanomyces stellatus]|uniref:Aste57867_23742 protein n=1 Tax=Aphanomyces stellatus TaxID=120398 RepID=A0A485LQD5_9STRA|nr:hypothetical protein As57867_023670 [Aphanomyces stellatus]VFU00387.1 Aste57867_23742 [Aphanomyces stellatus]